MTLVAPRAVIFDWDNTLVNTWPVIHAALVATFEAMGQKPWTFEQTKERVKKSMRDSFPELFGGDWQKAADIYQKSYRASHLSKLEPLPQALEVLEVVKKRGLYNVVVSNKKGPTLREEAQNLGWVHLFDAIVGADDAARDKPFCDPVHMALEKSGITPGEDVWFVGDSEIDLECAEGVGCSAILYGDCAAHPEYNDTHYWGFPYHAHVRGHAELLELLKR